MNVLKEMSISAIRKMIEQDPILSDDLLASMEQDPRAGVRTLAKTCLRKREKERMMRERLDRMMTYEREAYEKGYRFIAGIDEAGRGPLAGPVVAAAVILPVDARIMGINDSKQLRAKERESLYTIICETALSYGIGIVDPAYIDTYNILQATYEAMRRAVSKLDRKPDLLLNDAVTIPGIDLQQVAIIKGDATSQSIAAASILAKVTRDRLMIEYGKQYPQYGFEHHMGYGTAEHLEALQKYGASPLHRCSFAPVQQRLGM